MTNNNQWNFKTLQYALFSRQP